MLLLKIVLLSLLFAAARATNFTIINGQIFTPGLAIVDAPQPNTPLGGNTLHVALDVSGNGKLNLPPYPDGTPTQIHQINIFLSSYITGFNFTVSNGTAGTNNASLGDIMSQEQGSTVKHVNWVWPDCFVGDGKDTTGTARGIYNISIHQSFRLNNTDYYTIFDLPIVVTNSIDNSTRASCDILKNGLLPWDVVMNSTDIITPDKYPWTNGNGAQTDVPAPTSTSSSSDGLGSIKPNAGPGNGLGNGAGMVGVNRMMWAVVGGIVLILR